MILFMGLLSLVQILFLPGLLAWRFIRVKQMGLLEKVTFIFALSLIINFVLVLVLTVLGLYLRPVILVVFILELAAALWLYRTSLLVRVETLAKPTLQTWSSHLKFWSEPAKAEEQWQKLTRLVFYVVLLLGAISTLTWIGKVLYDHRLTVFSVWDSVVSWNPWAESWFANHIPENTRRYGQLIPANWSLSYQFIGSTEVQFFAKSIMPFFTLFTLLLALLLGLEFKSYGFFIAAILIQLMFKKFLGEHVYSGYVDSAVAFFSFASLYCLIKASLLKEKEAVKNFLALGAVMAGGAFCVKQPGLFILLLYPVLAYALVLRDKEKYKADDLKHALIVPIGLALAVSVPWYVLTELSILLGTNKTEFAWILEEVHRGRDLLDRFLLAVQSLEEYAFLFVAGMIALPLLKPVYRWILIAVVLPYSLFWALYASYSHRNLALALPLLAVVGGMGIEQIVEWLQFRLGAVKFKNFPILLALLVIVVLSLPLALLVPDTRLTELQTVLQKDILLRGLNRELYEFFGDDTPDGLILAGYPLERLPNFQNFVVSDSYEEYATYFRHRTEHPGIRYLLIPRTANEEILSEVMALVESGTYELIFEQNGYSLIRVSD